MPAPADRCKVPKALWRALAETGISPTNVLRQARLPAGAHLGDPAVLSTAQIFSLFKAVERLADDPDYVLRLVDAFDRSGHQPAFLAASYAFDFRDALGRILRFKRLSPSEQFLIEETGEEFSLGKAWLYASEPEPALSVDLAYAFAVALGRKGSGDDLAPLRLELTRPGPPSPAVQAWFGCPIRCAAPQNRLVFRTRDLDRPFATHNAEFLELLSPALAEARKDLQAQDGLADQVKALIKRSLASGRPDVSQVARDLAMSHRTLQRRMAQEGLTFRALVAEARRELAQHLLADASLSLDEVAVLLGYQDRSSFHRAFKGVEGRTPRSWRRRAGASSALH